MPKVYLVDVDVGVLLSLYSIVKGADCDLQYDIYLDLPDQDTGPAVATPLSI